MKLLTFILSPYQHSDSLRRDGFRDPSIDPRLSIALYRLFSWTR